MLASTGHCLDFRHTRKPLIQLIFSYQDLAFPLLDLCHDIETFSGE